MSPNVHKRIRSEDLSAKSKDMTNFGTPYEKIGDWWTLNVGLIHDTNVIPSVQEVVTILYSKLLYEMGNYFLDIQYLVLT